MGNNPNRLQGLSGLYDNIALVAMRCVLPASCLSPRLSAVVQMMRQSAALLPGCGDGPLGHQSIGQPQIPIDSLQKDKTQRALPESSSSSTRAFTAATALQDKKTTSTPLALENVGKKKDKQKKRKRRSTSSASTPRLMRTWRTPAATRRRRALTLARSR